MTTQQNSSFSTQSRIHLLFLFIIITFSYTNANAQQPSINSPSPQPLGISHREISASTLVVMAVIVGSFFSMSVFTLYLRTCTDFSYPPETDFSSHKSYRCGLDPSVIRTFPVFVYAEVKELKIGKGALECAVCLSEFEDDDTLRLIPNCDHVFHPDCIDAWFASHVTCPVCRAMLSQQDEVKCEIDIESQTVQAQSNSVNEILPELALSSREELSQDTNGNQENSDSTGDNNMQTTVETPRGKLGRVIIGKFPRSYSTGHSLVQAGECTERFTLRLPGEMRKQLVMMSASRQALKRTRSFDVLRKSGGEEGSSRGGRWRCWVASMTPSIVSRRLGGGRDGDGSSRGKVFPRMPV